MVCTWLHAATAGTWFKMLRIHDPILKNLRRPLPGGTKAGFGFKQGE